LAGLRGFASLEFQVINSLEPGRFYKNLGGAESNFILYFRDRDPQTNEMKGVVLRLESDFQLNKDQSAGDSTPPPSSKPAKGGKKGSSGKAKAKPTAGAAGSGGTAGAAGDAKTWDGTTTASGSAAANLTPPAAPTATPASKPAGKTKAKTKKSAAAA